MKKEYQTQQLKRLCAFLHDNPEKQCTIKEIEQALPEIGRATIYRQMEKLVQQGMVRRFARENSHGFVYQLTDGDSCNHHFHLKCVGCGKLIHLDETTSRQMQKSILKTKNFAIDGMKTMIFGTCNDCMRGGER